MSAVENEEKLERRIGFWGLLAMSVGVNIGGSLFALTGMAAGFSGPSLPLAMFISALPVLLALVPFCLLSIVYPTTSATYRYAQLVSPGLAKIYVLSLVSCMCIGGLPLFALVAGYGLEPIISVPPGTTGVLVLSLFYVTNLLGVGLTARIQLLLSLVLLLALITFVGTGIPHISTNNLTPLFPNGLSGVMAASGFLFTFCAGGLFVVDVGGEVINPEKNIPRALVMGLVIVLTLYIGIMFVTVGAVPWSALGGLSLVAVAETFMAPATLTFFIIGGAVIAAATTINTVFTIQARLILVIAEEALISPRLGRISTRFGTPHWALTLTYLISTVSLLYIPSIKFFGSMVNFAMILAVTLVCLAALKVAARRPDLFSHSGFRLSPTTFKMVCWIIIFVDSLIFLFLTVVTGWASLVFMGILLAAYLYSRVHKKKLGEIQVKAETTLASL